MMQTEERKDIKSMTLPELTEALEELGEKKFRAKQKIKART